MELIIRIKKKLFLRKIKTMKYLFFSILASIILFSCKVVHSTKFEIDNSGEAAVYIDMSQFVKKMGKMPKKAKKDVNFAEKKNASLDSITLIEYLSQIEGVTNVNPIYDDKNYNFGVEFKFEKPKNLNIAMNKIKYFVQIGRDSTATLNRFKYFSFSEKKLELKEPLKAKKDSMDSEKSSEKSAKMAKMISMEWQVSFAKRKIENVISDYHNTQKGKKQVTITSDGEEFEKRTTETITVIKFK